MQSQVCKGEVGKDTYRTSPHLSYRHSHCHSHTASGPARSGCSYSGIGTAHMFSHLPQDKKIKQSITYIEIKTCVHYHKKSTFLNTEK